jgi:hypothetical protein
MGLKEFDNLPENIRGPFLQWQTRKRDDLSPNEYLKNLETIKKSIFPNQKMPASWFYSEFGKTYLFIMEWLTFENQFCQLSVEEILKLENLLDEISIDR